MKIPLSKYRRFGGQVYCSHAADGNRQFGGDGRSPDAAYRQAAARSRSAATAILNTRRSPKFHYQAGFQGKAAVADPISRAR